MGYAISGCRFKVQNGALPDYVSHKLNQVKQKGIQIDIEKIRTNWLSVVITPDGKVYMVHVRNINKETNSWALTISNLFKINELRKVYETRLNRFKEWDGLLVAHFVGVVETIQENGGILLS